MKNLIYTLVLGIAVLGFFGFEQANAQVCVPDTQFTAPGFYPAALPELCQNTPFSQSITLVVPSTFTTPPPVVLTVNVDSVVVNSITDLPPGVTFACNPTNCNYIGGSTDCILFSGTPTMAGNYDMDVNVTVFASGFQLPLMLQDTLLVVVRDELMASVNTTDADCGLANGTATVSVTSTTGPFTYMWSTGDTTATVTGLAGGSYTVTVTDTAGCIKDLTAIVGSAASDLVIDSAASVVGWAGCGDIDGGTIAPNVTGTATPFSYAWSNSSTDSAQTGLASGTYTVTVTDNNGCVDVQTYDVQAPALLDVSLDGAVTDVSCNGDATGAAAVAVSGGDGNYTYNWDSNPAQTTAAATNLPAGTYTATVTDGLGCVKTVDATIDEPTALNLTVDVTDETGAGLNDGTASSTVSGGTPPYSYNWNGNDTTATALDSLAPGDYTLVVTDSNGCTIMETVTVVAGPGSVEALTGITNLKVFPNPSEGSFTLSLDLIQSKNLEISLFNMHGQLLEVRSQGFTSQVNENFDLNKKGIYLLQIRSGEEVASLKVVVR